MSMTNYGENIRNILAARGMTQGQLARSIGKSDQWLSKRICGRTVISLPDAVLIASGLRYSINNICGIGGITMTDITSAEAYYKATTCPRCRWTYMLIDTIVQRYTSADGTKRKLTRCPKCGTILEEETE